MVYFISRFRLADMRLPCAASVDVGKVERMNFGIGKLQRRNRREILGALSVLLLAICPLPAADPEKDKAAFEEATAGPWKEAFFDEFTGDWRDKWFLDGEIGTAENSPRGLRLAGGPRFGDNAHHVVLWTKDSFEGDVKIEYDYTRLDFEVRGVNILYIHATGSGNGPFARDITEWNELRKVPAMRMYFDHMNLYHISYAAFPDETDPSINYIRGRRYMPDAGQGLEGTDLTPDHYPPGLFEPGVPHHITVIKRGTDLLVRIQNDKQVFHGKLSNTALPDVTEGRIGLRHMQTRSARYKNFRVSERAQPAAAAD